MGALKIAALVLTLAIAGGWYADEMLNMKTAPTLPETWWKPGNEKSVNTDVRKFRVSIPDQLVEDLKYRLRNTRYGAGPLKGTGWTYGLSSKSLKEIVDYWMTKYDFKGREAVFNQYPQFITNIQGLDIHFLHVKPQNANGKRIIPLLMQHGWPGSVVEFFKIIPLLTTPRPEHDFVFEIIAPSLPGYSFSDGATIPGLGPAQIAVVLKNLMLRLGHKQFYTQGGDWGALITADLASMFPGHVLGMHSNMCIVNDAKAILKSLFYSIAPSLFVSKVESDRMFPLSKQWSMLVEETGYLHLQATKPDTIGAPLSDSPAGLAAYILEKFSGATNITQKIRDDGGLLEKFTMDELLDNIMLYWIPNSISTAVRIYAEAFNKNYLSQGYSSGLINVPSGCASFPYELGYQPPAILKSRYKNLIRMSIMSKGGHFAAMEEPQILADDVWAFIGEVETMRKTNSESSKQSQKTTQQGSKKTE